MHIIYFSPAVQGLVRPMRNAVSFPGRRHHLLSQLLSEPQSENKNRHGRKPVPVFKIEGVTPFG